MYSGQWLKVCIVILVLCVDYSMYDLWLKVWRELCMYSQSWLKVCMYVYEWRELQTQGEWLKVRTCMYV